MTSYFHYTDNPVRDAERYQEDLENRPCIHCAICGDALYSGDDYYALGDVELCPDCMEDNYKRTVADDDEL